MLGTLTIIASMGEYKPDMPPNRPKPFYSDDTNNYCVIHFEQGYWVITYFFDIHDARAFASSLTEQSDIQHITVRGRYERPCHE